MTPLDFQTSKKRVAWGALQGIDSGPLRVTKVSDALTDGRGHPELAMSRYDDGCEHDDEREADSRDDIGAALRRYVSRLSMGAALQPIMGLFWSK